ncbi:rhodanese-like domain-containing protein [Undibacterium oligocarboniphilum]|uniref:Sulfurtransferase n=1 Tax=Undibacterium oligocarboniphilum TaxID=666702 RepID=A0A850QGW7_9BURK|nr:rhodanese-like domain-containing protein [Undibacterium oligocarboniphilum]MBC3870670.1 sulfurtransferase [Undibacterium oligocarboniphilum]NVO78528.1 sulfurtransferase [Undibacterium oligocarboniphilum]
MQHITASELSQWLADSSKKSPVLLDVREPWEFETCHISGVKLIPMQTVPLRVSELDPEETIVCICHHGGRSMQVASFLERQGFGQVINLTGGVHAWSQQVDPRMPTY